MELNEMYEHLSSVTTIPIVPFKNQKIDGIGHRKNIRYLMDNNFLNNHRRRVISIAGTSLIHHFTPEEQIELIDIAGQEMADEGILISGIVPNPIATAVDIIRKQSILPNPPDVYLLMPLTGVADPEGIYQMYSTLGEDLGEECGAKFILYMRSKDHMETIIRLINESPHFVGVKVGTVEEDVPTMKRGIGDNGIVIWGVGDRCTKAASLGAIGHTSGIAVVAARACDEINNAQRAGDLHTSQQIENIIEPLENLRFMNNRQYNYSAVVEAMKIGGWNNVEPGEGGPFNPRVPINIAEQVKEAVSKLESYH